MSVRASDQARDQRGDLLGVPEGAPTDAPTGRVRAPRELHPVAWWVWALGLAAAASATTNPWLLALLAAVSWVVVQACRGDGTWARAYRLYLWLAGITVAVRVLFRVLLGGGVGGTVLLDLPQVQLPEWTTGIRLLGPVTREAVLAGLYDGMQLACILLAFGAANALANPKRLLKSLPPALYEIGTALVVAVTVLPQLADSARRVKHAQELRGSGTTSPRGRRRRIHGLRRVLVPVLEDAFERSMALAAGMDARGYGRTGPSTPGERRLTGGLMLLALMGSCVGVYGFLDTTAPRWLGWPMLVLGAGCAILALSTAGRRVGRSRYRPDTWQAEEILVAVSGLAVGAGLWWVAQTSLAIAHPGVAAAPMLDLAALLVPLAALLPVLVAPPAPTVATRARLPEVVR
ncbi:energy-coupling factor transporter transmembrane component T [Nocardioides campestrisoli]|uniref:energy-coupling factor transporter transmembrane component T n=1 Tax=Nocardioides campestrisoli TaxID=2736757 RepID=UPI00163D46C2|nr:energy-coupling factor transporter transmembrane component T [Nocardioides campestrisoli]